MECVASHRTAWQRLVPAISVLLRSTCNNNKFQQKVSRNYHFSVSHFSIFGRRLWNISDITSRSLTNICISEFILNKIMAY